ncbi:MAG: hypothetical protein LLG04_09350 [Parachlamydia sp.]|nr:hypothetical protein [Parachlamydia sp.]
MEPPKIAVYDPVALAQEARELKELISKKYLLSKKTKVKMVEIVDIFSRKMPNGVINPGLTGACRSLAKLLQKKTGVLNNKLYNLTWSFNTDLTRILLRLVDRPFTLMRVCKLWQRLVAEMVIKDIEDSVPAGYFRPFDKTKELYPQVCEFVKEIRKAYKKIQIPIEIQTFNRYRTITLLGCRVAERNLVELPQNALIFRGYLTLQ